jgi:Tol biopolymer transport system component
MAGWSMSSLIVGAALLTMCAGDAPARPLVERVSVSSRGVQASGDSWNPLLSPGGRYVAFASKATNLVRAGHATEGGLGVFVRDRRRRVTTRVGDHAAGVLGRNPFYFDGSRIGYVRLAEPPAYVLFDIRRRAETILNVGSRGQLVEVGDSDVAVSQGGRYFAFASLDAVNPGDVSFPSDVYLRDRVRGVTKRVSVGIGGAETDGASDAPTISADGRYVAFRSAASNLVAHDHNGGADAFVYDRRTGTTQRVSYTRDGEPTAGYSAPPAISPDGRRVAFSSTSSTLVAGDGNGHEDVFVRDLRTGTTRLVSVTGRRGQANGDSFRVAFLGPRLLMFGSNATNLVADDHDRRFDMFVRDLHAGVTVRAAPGGVNPDAFGWDGTITYAAQGRWMAFESRSPEHVAGDTNAAADVFVYGPLRQRWALPR